ncbi:DUF262 domain-containing protein [Pseudovibrio exalbescens]|uniref:DUF262 domain-containing protein n=1 Tax=Pseudovibrio exalbescens TaxID=197461 RepID=UPI002365A06B|nr:DUF262 domain-containing protein [Pseudovibrio exalbescens]MDD7909289.1 DUF262 domain-containing protein [Pseudovibrio exalbescens]
MSKPNYHSDPHISYLSQLLEEVKKGMIQVPRFQRPLVWTWEQRLELFRSIRDGIPMGAIMVWRTDDLRLECYENLGPHRLASPSSAGQYLLDGVQRLSTLLGALSVVDDNTDNEFDDGFDDLPPSEDFRVFFDFSKDDFVKADELENTQLRNALPMHLVFDSVGMLRFQRNVSGSDDEVNNIIHRSEDLIKAFREYKVPVIPIVTNDIEMATRTFQRINSQGKPMSEAHMIHALSWNSGFNLNARIKEAKIEHLSDITWSNIDDDIILKACKLAMGFGIYTKNADEIGNSFKTNPSIVHDVVGGLRLAAEFLKEHCKIPSPTWLPYSLQLVILTEIFRERVNISDVSKTKLTSWFWTTTYGEYFAGMSGDRFQRTLDDLTNGIDHDQWHLTEFKPYEIRRQPASYDFRSVRAKAHGLRLAERVNQTTKTPRGTELITEYGRDCIAQLLPRIDSPKKMYSSYANRFLINPTKLSTFKERFLTGDLEARHQDAFFLTPEMMNDLVFGLHQSFVSRRSEMFRIDEIDFCRPHLELFHINVDKVSSPQ